MFDFKNGSAFYNSRLCYRVAAIIAVSIAASACATQAPKQHEEWAATGYLTPGPTGDGEIIGLYETESECRAAGEAWMSRQVVGNPVYADCLPVDRN